MLVCFEQWVNSLRKSKGNEQIFFDGKAIRGSGQGDRLDALQLMSAMIVESGLTLTQKESEWKNNEIKNMQTMLSSLSVKADFTVTLKVNMDALVSENINCYR